MGKNGISAALIVKNEEAVLERCLRSLAGLDEIVIRDTGSRDRSKEIARDLGAKVIEGLDERPFHFAKARNIALSHVTNPWTLSLDADEVLREGSLGAMLDAVRRRPDVSGYDVMHINRAEEGGSEMPDRKLRLFRTEQFVWKHRICEQPIPKGRQAKVGFIQSCVIDHLPQPEKKDRRGQNLELLRLCVQEEPDYMQAWKQLGIEHVLREEWEEATPAFERYLSAPDASLPHEDCATKMFLGKCYARLGRMDEGLRHLFEAHELAPTRREPLYWAAIELIRIGDPWEAIRWLEGALKIEPNHLPAFSLYSAEIQGNLVEETLAHWREQLKGMEEPKRTESAPPQAR